MPRPERHPHPWELTLAKLERLADFVRDHPEKLPPGEETRQWCQRFLEQWETIKEAPRPQSVANGAWWNTVLTRHLEGATWVIFRGDPPEWIAKGESITGGPTPEQPIYPPAIGGGPPYGADRQ
jgi:hypothetical protein